jgi:hypothetical protein
MLPITRARMGLLFGMFRCMVCHMATSWLHDLIYEKHNAFIEILLMWFQLNNVSKLPLNNFNIFALFWWYMWD